MTPIELRARREALGLSQGLLADWLGVRQATVSRWEAGKQPIPGDHPGEPGVEAKLARLEDAVEGLIDRAVAAIDAAADAADDDGFEGVVLYVGDTDVDGVPAAAHRVAMARARRLTDVPVSIESRP